MGCGESSGPPLLSQLPSITHNGPPTLIIDFRRSTSGIFVEATGHNYEGLDEALISFFHDNLHAADARGARDADFAPMKYKITHLVRYTGTRNNMSNLYCMIADFMTNQQGWQLISLTGVNNELDLGTLTLQKLPAPQAALATLIIDFRRDTSNIFVEATGQNYEGIHETLKTFFQNSLQGTDARDAKDANFAPVKYKVTKQVKYTGTRNNMSNLYCIIADFMTNQPGWQLISLTGVNNALDLGTLTLQKLPASQAALATLIIDFRRDTSNFFVEATGQNYEGIHETLKTFFQNRLQGTDARDAKDANFAPVKYKITKQVKFTGTRNNMSNLYCMIADFMTNQQGWQLISLTGVNNASDLGTLTLQKLPASQAALATLIIDFRRDTSNIFVEATGQNYEGIHETLKTFFQNRLHGTDARDAKDANFAPVKYKITKQVKYTGTRNNMSNLYCKIADFMTNEQGWQLISLTGINNALDLGTLTFQVKQGNAMTV